MSRFFILFLFLISISKVAATNNDVDWWIADEYVNNSSLQYKWGIEYIKRIAFKRNDAVLDIGSGDGRLTAYISRKVKNGKVVGIDSSSSMINKAKQRFPFDKFKNISFVHQSVENIAYKNEFDWVVSFSTMHWVQDFETAFKNSAHSLKPNGRMFLYFAPDHGTNRLDHAIKDVMKNPRWRAYFRTFKSKFNLVTPLSVLKLINANHLLLCKIKIIKIKEHFKSKQEFHNWIAAWMPHTMYIPHHLRQKFINDVIDRYIEIRPGVNRNGKIIFVDYWLEVWAEKG